MINLRFLAHFELKIQLFSEFNAHGSIILILATFLEKLPILPYTMLPSNSTKQVQNKQLKTAIF